LGGGRPSLAFKFAYMKGSGVHPIVAARFSCRPITDTLTSCLEATDDENNCHAQLVESLSCHASLLYPDEFEEIISYPSQNTEVQRKLEALLEKTKETTAHNYNQFESEPKELLPIEIEAAEECVKVEPMEARFGCIARRACPQSDSNLAVCLTQNNLDARACDKEMAKVADCVANLEWSWAWANNREYIKAQRKKVS